MAGMDLSRGRTVFEQRFSKGPKAHYAVSLLERDGTFEVVCRWENPKSTDSRILSCRTRERAKLLIQQKIEDLTARGYDRHPAVTREAQAPSASAEVSQSLHDLATIQGQASEVEPLGAILARRRREASWTLE